MIFTFIALLLSLIIVSNLYPCQSFHLKRNARLLASKYYDGYITSHIHGTHGIIGRDDCIFYRFLLKLSPYVIDFARSESLRLYMSGHDHSERSFSQNSGYRKSILHCSTGGKVSDSQIERDTGATKPRNRLSSGNNCFVILSNIQSGSNIGDICRNSLAFNVSEVLIVGRNSYLEKMRGADRGAKTRLKFSTHLNHTEAREYLLQTHNCEEILGVEIHENAKSINDYPFKGNVAFMFGNEGGGLSMKQREVCSGFVYIPQYAAGGMASINVACASAIILHKYASWANYPESTRRGEKFE